MILSLYALALASAANPIQPDAAQMIGCHPQGKIAGCVTPYGQTRPHSEARDEATRHEKHEAQVDWRACHPEPSKNKGCLRPVARTTPAAS